MRSWFILLVCLPGAVASAAQAPVHGQDEALLRQHNLAVDDAGLRRFFRDRTLPPDKVAALKAKLQQLNATNFGIRTQAVKYLVDAGLNAKALLLEVVNNPATDLETANRAEWCLRQIGQGQEVELAQAAARLLQVRKPPETVATLLNYIPFAGDPQILPTVQDTLNALAIRDGRPDPALLDALHDPHPGKRMAAGVALIRGVGLSQKAAVQHLLKDPSVQVRLPVCLALVEAKDKDAVPHLIERLADAPADQLWKVTDLLERVAGDKAPAVYPSAKSPPAQVRDAWQKWWADNSSTVDLAKLSAPPPYLGYTLMTFMGKNGVAGGKVIELRPDRSTHFEIDNLSYPLDARVIGPNKVLVTEYQARRVSERDFKGNILWEYSVTLPIASQRSANGDTFIVTRRQLIVLDADKKTVLTYHPPNGTISAASRARDGQIVLLASTGTCHWLDAQGHETKSFSVGYVYPLGGNIEILPNRHVLVPLYRDGKVAELDGDGKVVWHAAVANPVSATRLPNGHTLVVNLGNQVQELDREGRTVWSHQGDSRAFRARGR